MLSGKRALVCALPPQSDPKDGPRREAQVMLRNSVCVAEQLATSIPSRHLGAFPLHARDAHAAGLAVIPTSPEDAKKPIIRWGRLRARLRLATVERWTARFTQAHLAYLPALSGHAVLDIDDRTAEAKALRFLGIDDTPIIIESGRGLHFPMRTQGAIASLDLRPFGIEGEIKAESTIVAAPGSAHPINGRQYKFVSGDWDTFRDAPILNDEALAALTGQPVFSASNCELPSARRNQQGSRNSSTFNHLRFQAHCGLLRSEAEAKTEALLYNQASNDPPELKPKVIATAKSVWRYLEKGTLRAPKGRAIYRPWPS